MKKILLVLALAELAQTYSFGQRNQRFKVFGTSLKASDVVGNRKFNDLGLKYYSDVINNLTDDTTTYLWRLGAVRLNVRDYTDGTISLFDLSTANHTDGYPLLDNIDFTFYKERGFQIMESKDPTLLKRAEYKSFKETMCDETKSLKDRRTFLWNDERKEFREKLLVTRYFINIQPITLNQKLVKKVVKDISVGLKSDVNSLLRVASTFKDSSDKNVDTIGLRLYFQRDVNRILDLRGNYISVIFQDQYIKRAKDEIAKIPKITNNIGANDDEFTRNLKVYIGNDTVALNSALFAFKLSGGIDRKIISADSIKSDLKTLFNIGPRQAAALAVTANFMFSKRIEEIFKNQFAKVWIIMFGTDAILDGLSYNDKITVGERKSNGKAVQKY